MEVIEHAAGPKRFVATATSLVKPGGLVLVSTLNRTLRSFALATVGAEYMLRWLEPGRRRWEQFVMPIEITGFARTAGFRPEPARNGLRPVQARLAAVVRYRRELPARCDEGGRLEPKLNRLYGSGHLRRRPNLAILPRLRPISAHVGHRADLVVPETGHCGRQTAGVAPEAYTCNGQVTI
jgi:hypothetical protein